MVVKASSLGDQALRVQCKIPFWVGSLIRRFGAHVVLLNLPVPTRFGIDSRTNKRVPLKFQDPREKRPRGFSGMHQEANDYLPRPISRRPSNDQFYVNVLRTLPGRGGIARSVVKIDRGNKTFPTFDVFTKGTPHSRQLL